MTGCDGNEVLERPEAIILPVCGWWCSADQLCPQQQRPQTVPQDSGRHPQRLQRDTAVRQYTVKNAQLQALKLGQIIKKRCILLHQNRMCTTDLLRLTNNGIVPTKLQQLTTCIKKKSN